MDIDKLYSHVGLLGYIINENVKLNRNFTFEAQLPDDEQPNRYSIFAVTEKKMLGMTVRDDVKKIQSEYDDFAKMCRIAGEMEIDNDEVYQR